MRDPIFKAFISNQVHPVRFNEERSFSFSISRASSFFRIRNKNHHRFEQSSVDGWLSQRGKLRRHNNESVHTRTDAIRSSVERGMDRRDAFDDGTFTPGGCLTYYHHVTGKYVCSGMSLAYLVCQLSLRSSR